MEPFKWNRNQGFDVAQSTAFENLLRNLLHLKRNKCMSDRLNTSVRLYNDASLAECILETMVSDVPSALKLVGAREGFIAIVNEDTGAVAYEGLSPLSLMPVSMRHVYYWSLKFCFPWAHELNLYLENALWFDVADAFKSEDSYCAVIQRSFHPTWFREGVYKVEFGASEIEARDEVFTEEGYVAYFRGSTSSLFFPDRIMSHRRDGVTYTARLYVGEVSASIHRPDAAGRVSYRFDDAGRMIYRHEPYVHMRQLAGGAIPSEVRHSLESQLQSCF